MPEVPIPMASMLLSDHSKVARAQRIARTVQQVKMLMASGLSHDQAFKTVEEQSLPFDDGAWEIVSKLSRI
jgi:uncharacterized protein YoaH (UPF0181 family)